MKNITFFHQRILHAHKKTALHRLSESMCFGIISPLLLNANSAIIDGEARLEAAELAGMITVPCRILDFSITDEEHLCLRQLLNPSARLTKVAYKEHADDTMPFRRALKKKGASDNKRAMRVLSKRRKAVIETVRQQLSYDISLVEVANQGINCIRWLDELVRQCSSKPPQNLLLARERFCEAVKLAVSAPLQK